MKKSTTAICMIIYLLAVTLVFSGVSVLCSVDTVDAYPSQDGSVDLTGIDFNTDVVTIQAVAAMIYDGVFYMPEDFAANNIMQKGFPYGSENGSMKDYGTVQIILKLPADRMYAISARNTSYAQRLFINGEEYAPIGVTGESAESVTPRTTRYTEAFRPEEDTTEIILHYSNFVHADTGGLYTLTLGSVDNVTRIGQQKTLQVTVSAVALLTAMLFFFGLFLFFPKNRYLLWFSLACGCIALRGLITGDKALMLLLPNLNWDLTIRLEYLTTCGMALFSVLYLIGLFPGTANKWAVRSFTVFCALNAAFICLVPPLVFTANITPVLMIYVAFSAYLLLAVMIAAIRKKKSTILSGTEQILLFIGLTVYLILAAWEIYAHENAVYLLGLDFAQVGMMIFLFINQLTLALGFSRTERKLDAALQSERELEESNQLLERLDMLKNDFLQNISHEMRTPLMVMSGYAQLADWQIGAGSADGETQENLRVVSKEARRLAELASGLLDVSADVAWERSPVSAAALFEHAAVTCRSILAKNGNKLEICVEDGLPALHVNEDMIIQVLLNLTVNACRHTRNGTVLFNAQCTIHNSQLRDSVTITVEDNGSGIAPELLPHVFERRVSGDGGNGLGLAICKDAVESHGGEISIENIPGGGTWVTFTLPVKKEEAEDESDNFAG